MGEWCSPVKVFGVSQRIYHLMEASLSHSHFQLILLKIEKAPIVTCQEIVIPRDCGFVFQQAG
jgi:hypothetical protein